MIVTATLIKKTTDDGLHEIHDNVPLGKKYKIDLSTIRMMDGYNHVKNISWKRREMVYTDCAGWYPTELLMWEGKETANEQ